MEIILDKLLVIPAILIAFTAQGYSKAKMADKLGDKTPRFQGRLSLSPFNHIDLVGFIMILFIGFGWTKPVETNPSAYKRGYKDAIKVTLVSLFSMLIVAFIGSFILALFYRFGSGLHMSTFKIIASILANIIYVNVSLFIFNLLPLPGLAGFELFREINPKKFYEISGVIYRYQLPIIIGIAVIGRNVLGIPISFIANTFIKLATLIIL
ncbi:site-2 protease family protein [Clostridium sp.]|uniref:site-2 protease family protein n=1 Tax=Clostridium sp. TaxID=1506 RepID=UPI00261E91CC|nr:site-2 protease family protein [Clostridium sp.]